jgi:CRISPR/Cas system-associated endoribonuclease Cas2
MEEAKKNQRAPVTPMVLSCIAAAGLIGVAAVAPGALSLLQPFIHGKRRYSSTAYVEGVMRNLQKRGLIKVWMERGEPKAALSEKGRRALARYTLEEKSKKKREWDGKWRLVIFDIHEFRRTTRDRIRKNIASFGFLKLQNSVWVYPHECEEIVVLLKADCKIGQELLYITAERIEGDDWLRRKFGLNKE